MELILWRHGETEKTDDSISEAKRPLTAKGIKQAATMAQWLSPRLPKKTRIVAAGTLAACSTADALGLPYEIERKLQATASCADLLAASGWPDEARTVLLVCHQPGIGRLASLMLGNTDEGEITVKKCGVFWFSKREREHRMEMVLRAVMYPDLA
jgi:phosphohistidine phosphatase